MHEALEGVDDERVNQDNDFCKFVVGGLKEGVSKLNLMGGAALQRRKRP